MYQNDSNTTALTDIIARMDHFANPVAYGPWSPGSSMVKSNSSPIKEDTQTSFLNLSDRDAPILIGAVIGQYFFHLFVFFFKVCYTKL